jgi:hypothetical protein
LFARNRPSIFGQGALNHFNRQQQLKRLISASDGTLGEKFHSALEALLLATSFVVF